jgi:hypothetical protein
MQRLVVNDERHEANEL